MVSLGGGGEGEREQGEGTKAQGVGSETHVTHVVASPFGVLVMPAHISALKSRAMVLGPVGAEGCAEGAEAGCNSPAAHGTRPDLVAPAVFTAGVPLLLLLLAHDTFGHSVTLEVGKHQCSYLEYQYGMRVWHACMRVWHAGMRGAKDGWRSVNGIRLSRLGECASSQTGRTRSLKRTQTAHRLGALKQEEDCERFEAHVTNFTGAAHTDSSCSISYISLRRETETARRCELTCTFGGTLPDPPELHVHVSFHSLDAAPGSTGKREGSESTGKREPLGNSPLSFSLQPGPICVFASEAAGPGLSLATAGIIQEC